MALIKMKPTSPGARFVIKVSKAHLWKGGPLESLTSSQAKHSGRNNVGRITTRHKGGGSRQKYRLIDFRRDKDGIKGVVEDVKGKAKEAAGTITGNEDLEREGEAQQSKAEAQRDVAKHEADAEKSRAEAQAQEAQQRAAE